MWPIKGGEAAEGTSGLVAAVKGGEGTIGYADESQAGGLGLVSVKVGEEFVAPSAEGAAKALAVSKPVEGRADVDMAIDIDRTTTESGAYPVLLASYLIACQTYDDANEAALVKGFLSYIVSDEGQQAAADAGRLRSARRRALASKAQRHRRRHRRQVTTSDVRRPATRVAVRPSAAPAPTPDRSPVSVTAPPQPPRAAKPVVRPGDRIFAGTARVAAPDDHAGAGRRLRLPGDRGLPGAQRPRAASTHRPPTSGRTSARWSSAPILAAVVALVIAVPFSIGVALFISHYAPPRVAAPIAYVIDLLAAVPSVVYGLWGGLALAPATAAG